MLDSDQLIAALFEAMKKCTRDECNNREFTKKVKECTSAFCCKYGVTEVLYTRPPDEESKRKSEFLVDLCAFADQQMVLALESEWGTTPESFFFDFRKLLHLKTPLKIMICDLPVAIKDELRSVAEFLARYPDHRFGEEYIIFNFRGGQSKIYCHRWKPERDGAVKPEDVRFAVVEGFPKQTK
jgi:hypothetical protein